MVVVVPGLPGGRPLPARIVNKLFFEKSAKKLDSSGFFTYL
jgi:hypothetical protein